MPVTQILTVVRSRRSSNELLGAALDGVLECPNARPLAVAVTGMHSVSTGVGEELFQLAAKLYPICRSITGEGVRRSLAIIGEHLPLVVHEVPSGSAAY